MFAEGAIGSAGQNTILGSECMENVCRILGMQGCVGEYFAYIHMFECLNETKHMHCGYVNMHTYTDSLLHDLYMN
jgi:hypothetical protein